MRTFFFLLVLANAVFYVWSQGYFGVGNANETVRTELAAEKMHLLKELPAKAAESCLLLANLDAGALAKAEPLVASVKGVVSTTLPQPALAQWWVTIGPLADKRQADRKFEESRKFGIKDASVVTRDGEYFVSYGLFSSEENADERLQELKKAGVRSAKLLERAGKVERFDLHLRIPDSARSALDAALREQWPQGAPESKAAVACDVPAGGKPPAKPEPEPVKAPAAPEAPKPAEPAKP